MAPESAHSRALAIASRQDDVIAWTQLYALGFTDAAIRHALRTGRFHRVRPGVVAVGRPAVGLRSRCRAVTLAYPYAGISHDSASLLAGTHDGPCESIHVTVPADRHPRAADLIVHRREPMPRLVNRGGIPVTTPLQTLIDLAATWSPDDLEAVVNESDRLGLLRIDSAIGALERMAPAPGTRRLSNVLSRHSTTDSRLERRFLAIVRKAALPQPKTRCMLNGFRVDFFWPELGLVVETDGLTYHRTPAQQARDRRRDQVHTAGGLTCLRFPNAQIRDDAATVVSILRQVIDRLGANVQNPSP